MITVFTCIFHKIKAAFVSIQLLVPTPNFWTVMYVYTNHILTDIKNEQKKIHFI